MFTLEYGEVFDNLFMVPEAGFVAASFVAIVDRLIAAVKAREESHQHLIDDIVAPYFDELQSAYSVYLTTLRKAKRMLEKSEPFSVIHAEIESLRATDLVLRDKVREMADTYESVLVFPDVGKLFNNASSLFGYWSGYHHSGTLRVMAALAAPDGSYSPNFVIDSIQMTLDSAEEQWRQLARQYATIRAKYLQPISVTGNQKPTDTFAISDQRLHKRIWRSMRMRFFPTE